MRRALLITALAIGCSTGDNGTATTNTSKNGALKPPLVIFATGDVGGDTEQCGCKARPMGGVARRAKQIKDRIQKYGGRAFVVDAGDMFCKMPLLQPRDVEQAHETAAFLAKSMRMMDAAPVHAVGERDLAIGLGALRRIAQANELTLLAANLVHAKTGTAAFAGFKIVERAGVKIGFVGAAYELDPQSIASTEVYGRNGLEVKPADGPVADAAREARKQGAELVIGLFHLGTRRAKEVLAKLEPGLIDFAIAAHDRQAGNGFEPLGKTGIVTTGERGKWVLALEVELAPGATGVRDAGAIDSAKKQIQEIDQRIADYEKPDPTAADPVVAQKVKADRLATIDRLKRQRARVEADLATVSTEPRHLIRTELVPLDIALPEDPEMLAALNAYKDRLNVVNAKTGALPAALDPHQPRFVGTEACRACHQPAFQHWTTTKHAKAWATMERTRQTGNLDCIPCHTTGFDRPGGPSGLTNLARFLSVGCESCHGPGSRHVQQPKEVHAGIPPAQVEKVCAECHRVAADQKPFVFAERLPKILGLGHGKKQR